MSHWLFLPDDALNDLETLSGLSPDQIQKLRNFFDSKDFRLRYAVYVQVAELLGISDEAAAELCAFINYIQTQRTKSGKTGSEVMEELSRFLQGAAAEGMDRTSVERVRLQIREKHKVLAEFFSELPTYDFSEKVRGLEAGPVPHLHEFRAYCDLRPVYTADADEIVEFFPVIILKMVTHSAATDKYGEMLMQLTEDDLAEFQKQFERLEKKLAGLKVRCASLLGHKGKEGK